MKEIEKVGMPEVIRDSGKGVLLQGFHPSCAEELWAYILSDRESPARRKSWDGLRSLAEVAEYLSSCDVTNPNSSEFGYFIRDLDGSLVGSFHIHTISWWNHRAEVGYGVHHGYEGKGWASKALQVIEPVLQKIGFHRIEIRTDPENKRSCALAERNGYQLEGVLRHETRTRDGFRDSAVYAKLL